MRRFSCEVPFGVGVGVIDNHKRNPEMGFIMEPTQIGQHLSPSTVRLNEAYYQNSGGKASECSMVPTPKGAYSGRPEAKKYLVLDVLAIPPSKPNSWPAENVAALGRVLKLPLCF